MVPSAFTIQVNCSQPPMVALLQVIGFTPFSLETYLPILCKPILPPPASTTRNCSQPWAVGRLQFMACVPFSLLTYRALNPFNVMVWPIGAPPPPPPED